MAQPVDGQPIRDDGGQYGKTGEDEWDNNIQANIETGLFHVMLFSMLKMPKVSKVSKMPKMPKVPKVPKMPRILIFFQLK